MVLKEESMDIDLLKDGLNKVQQALKEKALS